MSAQRDFSEITERLGETYEIALNTYKPFACGIVIHPSIDGCIQLRDEHGLNASDVERIELRAHPLVLELTGKTSPQTGVEGKFSVYHSCAAAIIWGAAGESEYSDDAVRNSEAVALARRVTVKPEAGIRADEVHIALTTTDGRILTKHVKHAKGSLERPLSNEELESKFRRLVHDVLPAPQKDDLIRMCWEVEVLKDAAELARVATTKA